jgi:serine/threonine protein kinase
MSQDEERSILEAALKLPPKERAAYLDQACAGEPALRERIVQALFEAAARAGGTAHPSPGVKTVVVPGPPPEPCEKPGDFIGRYKLLELLGEGGMGSVWVAEEREVLRRRVALKVIKPGRDTKEVIARFEAERQALALLDHRHIAKVFDAGATDRGRPFFVMELVQGIRITEYCDLNQLPTAERLKLFVQICDAVQHAHERGIIHRDLKPPNLLVAIEQGVPVPKIIDFGIAKAVAGQRLTEKTLHTSVEEFMGTPAYMSPEQAEMNPLGIDARSDVYSLGVLLYELLTSITPFAAERLRCLAPDQIRRILREEEPVPPSTQLTGLSAETRARVARHHACQAGELIHLVQGDLDRVVMKCLEKDRTRRYDSAKALAEDVGRYLSHQPVHAIPPNALYRARKWFRRNRQALGLGAAGLVFMMLVAGLLLSSWRRNAQPRTGRQWLASIDGHLAQFDRVIRGQDQLQAAIDESQAATQAFPYEGQFAARLAWAKWLLYEENNVEETRAEANYWASNTFKLSTGTNNPEAHLVLGLLALDAGELSTATNYLLNAKKLTHSTDPVVLISLASALRAAGLPSEELVQSALDYAGDRWAAFVRIGNYFIRYVPGKDGLDRAQANFQRAVTLAEKSPLARRFLGQVLLLGVRNGGDAELRKSLKGRRTPQTLMALGKLLNDTNLLFEAIRADPRNYIYHVATGLVLHRSGASAAAAAQFNLALGQTQDILNQGVERPLVRAYQAVCLAAQREAAMAVGDLSRAETAATAAQADIRLARAKASRDCTVLQIVRIACKMLGDVGQLKEIQDFLEAGQK